MFCHCGCGKPTGVSDRTVRKFGWVKGEPRQFLRGHNRRLIGSAGGKYLRVLTPRGERPAHVAIVEAVLGRAVPEGVEVHHVDSNRQNNAHRNLVVCQDRSYHRLLHARARIVRSGGNPNTQNLCRACRRCMDFSAFHRNDDNRALGTCTICKVCQSARDAARYQRNVGRAVGLPNRFNSETAKAASRKALRVDEEMRLSR